MSDDDTPVYEHNLNIEIEGDYKMSDKAQNNLKNELIMFVCFSIALGNNNENKDTSEQLTKLLEAYLDYKKEQGIAAKRFNTEASNAA